MNQAAGMLLLSGPPGAGKSTVARILADTAEAPTVYIEGDSFWHLIVKDRFGGGLRGRQQNYRLVVKSMMLAAIPYLRGGYGVILDFTIPPDAFPLFEKWFGGIRFDYIVLCPSEAVCAARARDRTEGAMPDYAPYRAIHAEFCALGEWEGHAIRNDDAAPARLAAHIRDALPTDAYQLSLPGLPEQTEAPQPPARRRPHPWDD